MDVLGAKRQTPSEQIRYLMDIAVEFQRITRQALNSDYGRTDLFDDNSSLRIPTIVLNRGDLLKDVIVKQGHMFSFTSELTQNAEPLNEEARCLEALTEPGKSKIGTDVRTTDDRPELEDVLHQSSMIEEPFAYGILAWLDGIYHQSRDMN